MSFYKLETTHKVVPTKYYDYTKRTFKFYCNSYKDMEIRLYDALNNKAKVTVKEISEAEYVRGTE